MEHGAWRELVRTSVEELKGNYFFLSDFFTGGVNDFLRKEFLAGKAVYNPAFVLGLKKRRMKSHLTPGYSCCCSNVSRE
jgi:hypothetical protein